MFGLLRTKPHGVFARAGQRIESRGAVTAKTVVLSITGFLIGAIWLAFVTTIPELVRASGTLLPTDHYRQLQAPEQSIVDRVLVEEGQRVKQEQVLAVLSSPDLEQSLEEAARERAALEDRLANLRLILDLAEADRETYEIEQTGDVDLSYAAVQLAHFAAKQGVQTRLRQHLETTIGTLRNAHDLTMKRVRDRRARVRRAEELFASNLTPRRDLESQRDGLDQLQANLIEIEVRLSQSERDLAGVSATLEQNLIDLLDRTDTEKFDLEQRLNMLSGQISAMEKRRKALSVRAKEDGIIHAVGYPNAGEVIATGATLFELLPDPPHLVALLEIDPVDIGHIARGDTVTLKFDTYDARRFGQITGQITSISPNSVMDEQTGISHFRATVALESSMIGQGEWERPLHAGMGTTAEIVTDERTVLAYLLKPINRSFNRAFGER